MVLMYHHVAPREAVPSDAALREAEGWGFRVTPEGFARHLALLGARGFRFVSLERLFGRAMERGVESRNEVAITFDDAWRDQIEHALPVLQHREVPATFFVPTGEIRGVRPEMRMDPDQLRLLAEAGMTIGGHSHTHRALTRLPQTALSQEIGDSRRELEDRVGHPVLYFAYPGGAFNRAVEDEVARSGYVAACCSMGPARIRSADRYHMFRVALSESAATLRDRVRMRPRIWFLLRWRIMLGLWSRGI